MTTYVRPAAVAQDNADMLVGWNISPNTGYTLQVTVTSGTVVVILSNADGSALIGSGLALVGVAQPVTITPVSGQTISMADVSLGWHILITANGTEGDRTIQLDPMVDMAARTHPVYAEEDLALAAATADIDAGTHYVRDITVTFPLGVAAEGGDVVSVPVDGESVTGQVEIVTWSGDADGTSASVVVRTFAPIRPAAYAAPPAPPAVVDDTAETDAATVVSGNVLTNDTGGGLTVSAVNGLSANVGEEVAGSNGGVFVIGFDGSWAFDPAGDFNSLAGPITATTSANYHASNGVAEARATLMVTVGSVNAQPWTPAEITTALWLDAADSSTITLNGSAVREWRDKSGNSRHATQGTTANQPTYQATGMNSLPAISFDGSDDYLQLVQFAQASGQNIFAVVDTTNIGTSWRVFMDRSSGSVYNMALLFGSDVNYTPSIYWNSSGRAVSAATRRKAIFRWSFSAGAPSSALTQIDDGVVTTSTFTASVLTNWLGINTSYPPQNSNIRICEIIMLTAAPDASTLAKIQGYFAHKWLLASNLSSVHPYKLEAPTL